MNEHQIRSSLIAEIRRRKNDVAKKWYENQFSERLLKKFPNAFAEKAKRDVVINDYMHPILDVLVEYAKNNDKIVKYLYLTLKRTYAPHREGYAVLNDYYSQTVPYEIYVLIEELPQPAQKYAREWLENLHKDLFKKENAKTLTVAFVGDCLLGEIISTAGGLCAESNIVLDSRYYYFSTLMGTELDISHVAELLSTTPVDIVALSFLTYDGIPFYRALLRESKASIAELNSGLTAILDVMRNYIARLRELSDATILLHNASGLPLGRIRGRLPLIAPLNRHRRNVIQRLNDSIEALASEFDNLLIVDEASTTRKYGLRTCHKVMLPAKIRKNAVFHPTWFGVYLASEYYDKIAAYSLLKGIKLLLIDFDNTLWKGVMAEGEVKQDIEFQKLLSRLKRQGILLAALSKNDPKSIRWDEMHLKQSDFVSLKIGWSLKATSILDIADELNLGVSSFLLIDDNPVERELVEKSVPGVRSLDPAHPDKSRILEMMFQMPSTKDTDEAKARTGMYKEQSERNQALKQQIDYESMMSSLGLRVWFGHPSKKDFDRVCELVERTNQFNTTTIRYTRQELMKIANAEDSDIYISKLEDKFGKLGTVVVVVVKRSGDTALIENFIMSCRAMGFGLEILVLSLVINEQENCRQIRAKFIATERNGPSAGLFKSGGFREADDGLWILPSKADAAAAPSWFQVARMK